jgi:hydroxypyruvate reductase
MIRNRSALSETPAHELAVDCLEAGIEAAQPARVVRGAVTLDGTTLEIGSERYDLTSYDSVLVLGGGNAAAHVARALEDLLGEFIDGGIVVTDDPVQTRTVEVRPADHPIPSQRGVESTQALLEVATRTDENTLVLAVITGGGSACMVAPADGISLGDLQATTDGLLDSGASIHEINAVRKHLSQLKGGRLAQAVAPATVSALVLSDVVGNDLDVIASGPLVPDSSTYADAMAVMEDYSLTVPTPVRRRLEAGERGENEETPGPDDGAFDQVRTHLVGTTMTALEAARTTAQERGYATLVLSSRIRGPARQAALTPVAVAEEILDTDNPIAPPAVVLSGGETTVRVTGDGHGGPNQEFALSAALDLPAGAVLGAVDTDGTDGNTEVAGAVVDSGTVTDREAATSAVEDNDAHAYLASKDAVVDTGQTGTNVNDMHVLVVDGLE